MNLFPYTTKNRRLFNGLSIQCLGQWFKLIMDLDQRKVKYGWHVSNKKGMDVVTERKFGGKICLGDISFRIQVTQHPNEVHANIVVCSS